MPFRVALFSMGEVLRRWPGHAVMFRKFRRGAGSRAVL